MSGRYHKPAAGLKHSDCALTLGEIAQELGITRERVRQLEVRALRKAKQILEQRGFTLQDLVPEADHQTEGSHLEEM